MGVSENRRTPQEPYWMWENDDNPSELGRLYFHLLSDNPVSMLMWPSKEGVSTEAVVPLGGCTVLVISAKGAHQQNLVQ